LLLFHGCGRFLAGRGGLGLHTDGPGALDGDGAEVEWERLKGNAMPSEYIPIGNHRRNKHLVSFTEDCFTTDETEFMLAMDQYKREKDRPFPAWSEVLQVLKGLGYRKELPPGSGEDGSRPPLDGK
jgi:hypothetical protein